MVASVRRPDLGYGSTDDYVDNLVSVPASLQVARLARPVGRTRRTLFRNAQSFDQDLGWCVVASHADLSTLIPVSYDPDGNYRSTRPIHAEAVCRFAQCRRRGRGSFAPTPAGDRYTVNRDARCGSAEKRDGDLYDVAASDRDWFGWSVAIDGNTVVVGQPSGEGRR